MSGNDALSVLRSKIWQGRLPLEIRIAASECRSYDQSSPYLISCPRLTYLPSLLPKLLRFFAPSLIADPESLDADSGYFVYDSVHLKSQMPVGLLYDVYVLSTQQLDDDRNSTGRSDPFRLTVHFSPQSTGAIVEQVPVSEQALHDGFINSVKEADFLRSGTAKPIMSLSAADSKALWTATQNNDLATFARIHDSLLPSSGNFRNIPLRVYLPASDDEVPNRARVRVLQGQFSPTILPSTTTTASQLRAPSGGPPQTLGTALNALIPSLFPSRRAPILARPILHGAQVSMSASLIELAQRCCYPDGWVNVVVAMTN